MITSNDEEKIGILATVSAVIVVVFVLVMLSLKL